MFIIETRILQSCPVCDSGRLQSTQRAYDFETQTGDYEITECASCGIGFTNPQPLETEIPRLYLERTSSDFPKVNALTAWLRKANIKRSIAKIMGEITGEDLNAIEYGCGDGAFTIGMSEHPRVRRITAVDFHITPPRLLKESSNPKIEYLSVGDFEKGSDQFHIIFLRHVLEHSFLPEGMLTMAWEHLCPGGMVVIEVPNFESLGRLIFAQNYFALYVPRHLYHFRIAPLRMLIERHFRVLSVTKTHTPVWGKSIGNLFRLNIPNTGLAGIGTFPLQVLVDKAAGTSSVIRVIAQKVP